MIRELFDKGTVVIYECFVNMTFDLLVRKTDSLAGFLRFDERAKLQADHDRVLQSIKEKLAECQHWQKQHQVRSAVRISYRASFTCFKYYLRKYSYVFNNYSTNARWM